LENAKEAIKDYNGISKLENLILGGFYENKLIKVEFIKTNKTQ